MKREILKKIQGFKGAVEIELMKREDYYNTKSQSWQDSEGGETYQEETDALSVFCDALSDAIEEFESSINF